MSDKKRGPRYSAHFALKAAKALYFQVQNFTLIHIAKILPTTTNHTHLPQ